MDYFSSSNTEWEHSFHPFYYSTTLTQSIRCESRWAIPEFLVYEDLNLKLVSALYYAYTLFFVKTSLSYIQLRNNMDGRPTLIWLLIISLHSPGWVSGTFHGIQSGRRELTAGKGRHSVLLYNLAPSWQMR